MFYSFLHIVSFDPHSSPCEGRVGIITSLLWVSALPGITHLINVGIRLLDSSFMIPSYKIYPFVIFLFISPGLCAKPQDGLPPPSAFLAPTFIITGLFERNKDYQQQVALNRATNHPLRSLFLKDLKQCRHSVGITTSNVQLTRG